MKFYLKVYNSESNLQIHELKKQLCFVGRSANCHIKVESKPYISRCHISLVLSKEGQRFYYTAYDGNVMLQTSSSSGLYIDKQKTNIKKLKSGMIIDFLDTGNKTIYPYLEYYEESEMEFDMATETHDFDFGED